MSIDSYKIKRHRVFISYHHSNDYPFKKNLIERTEYNYDKHASQSIFENCSVGINDIDDTYLTDEDIRKIIRDEYIQDASVLILLCGTETKGRKFVDWELHAAMYNSETRPKLGILVINLPVIENKQAIHGPEQEVRTIIGNNSTGWVSLNTRGEFERNYPYMPSRIIDNFESGINDKTITPIIVVDWSTIANDNYKLKLLIDKVFNYSRDSRTHYNHSTPLRRRNF